MKKIAYIMICLSAFLASCGEKFLDLTPPSNLSSAAFYKTQSDINQAVLASYGKLRDLYNSRFVELGEIRSDNTTYSWLAGNPINEKGVDQFSEPLLPDNGFLKDTWEPAYNVILRCNLVINRIGAATFTDEKLRPQYEGEARFLRALMYFWLNKVFGGYGIDGQLLGVCKVETELTQAQAYEKPRASLQEIYDLIISDLTFAAANLPKSYASSDKGRVTSAGASAMLAKVYMTMGGYPMNKGNEYYSKAIQQIESFFTTYPDCKLVASYKDLFDVTKKNSVESLFEVQYKKGAPNGATGSPWNNDFAPRFSDKEVVQVGDKSGKNAPTPDMSAAYETADPRKYVSMRDGWKNAKTGASETDKYVCKYYDVSTSGSDNGNNWIELRVADIYLLYSEALVRTGGDKSKALDYLNKIRQRARNTPGDPSITPPADLLKDYTLADFADDNAFLLAIEKERRVELAFENHRWFDLVRTGRAKDVMMAEQAADAKAFTWSDDMLIYPIPTTVMQSNPGKIIQNKGYTQL